jgi:hypothetical protein
MLTQLPFSQTLIKSTAAQNMNGAQFSTASDIKGGHGFNGGLSKGIATGFG